VGGPCGVSEAIHEQLVAAAQTLLQGIVGDGGVTYWYTPDRVLRAPAFHAGCLDESLTTIYTMVPVRVDARPITSSLGMDARLTVDLALATRFKPDTESPFKQSAPIRWTVQTRLEKDAKKRLASNYTLLGVDGAHRFTTVPVVDYAADLTGQQLGTYLEGWAVVYLRVVFRYIYTDQAP
jgi:hypothetical protein